MDFAYSPAETLLQDSVRRFCAHRYGAAVRTSAGTLTQDFVRDNWREFGRLGWLEAATAAPAAPGESDDLRFAPFVVGQELGRALAIEPYWACAQMVGQALRLADEPDKAAHWRAALSSGDELFAFAHAERRLADRLDELGTTAQPCEDGYRISGRKSLVIGAPLAGRFVVTARVAGTSATAGAYVLLLVRAGAAGLTLSGYRTIDDGYAADLHFDDVAAEPIALVVDPDRFDSVLQAGMIGLCAEAVGTLDTVLSTTRDYLVTRRQYGVTLGSLQALQHRMADMFVEVEMSRSILLRALRETDGGSPALAAAAARAAYLHICRSADFVGRNGIQLHGAMGMTESYLIGRCFKRLATICRLFGGPDRIAADLSARLA